MRLQTPWAQLGRETPRGICPLSVRLERRLPRTLSNPKNRRPEHTPSLPVEGHTGACPGCSHARGVRETRPRPCRHHADTRVLDAGVLTPYTWCSRDTCPVLAVAHVCPDVALGPRTRAPAWGTRPELAAPRPLPRPLCADIVLPHKGAGQWPGGGGAGPVGIDLPGLGVGCAQRGPAGPPAQVPGAEGEAQGWGTWSASWEQQSRPEHIPRPSRPHQPISRGRGTGWEGLCPVPGQRAPRGQSWATRSSWGRPLGRVTSGSRWPGPHGLLPGRRGRARCGADPGLGAWPLPPTGPAPSREVSGRPARCQADTQAPGRGLQPSPSSPSPEPSSTIC